MAVYTAAATALARAIWTRGAMRIVALAATLTITEWLRGYLFTGFPWNTFGYAFVTPLALAQAASLIGIWGLTFIAVSCFAAPAVLADDRSDTRRRWIAPALAVAIVVALAAFGTWRLTTTPTVLVDGVRLRIMQPNLPQNERFNYSQKQAVMDRYTALSDRAAGPNATGIGDATHLIWPESAFPFFLTREADAMAQIAKLLPLGTVLITGAVRAPETVPTDGITRAYNSVYVLDHDASILAIYDKVHLVPFGEFLPFQDALERLGLMQLTKVRGGFIPGDRRRAQNDSRCAPVHSAGLLRDHLSGRGRPARRASGLAAQPHQRRLVWRQPRALPAFPAGPHPRHRGRLAAGARRQHRHIRRGRPVGPGAPIAATRRRRGARCTPAAGPAADDLRPRRRRPGGPPGRGRHDHGHAMAAARKAEQACGF